MREEKNKKKIEKRIATDRTQIKMWMEIEKEKATGEYRIGLGEN
jgi:hypothetical protein